MRAGGRKRAARAAAERGAGFTIAEVLVAITIFAAAATALAGTLAAAHRARQSSANWLTASQLAEEELERLRAGERARETNPQGSFQRRSRVESAPGYEGLLERLQVRVTWEDHGPKSFTLSALMRVGK